MHASIPVNLLGWKYWRFCFSKLWEVIAQNPLSPTARILSYLNACNWSHTMRTVRRTRTARTTLRVHTVRTVRTVRTVVTRLHKSVCNQSSHEIFLAYFHLLPAVRWRFNYALPSGDLGWSSVDSGPPGQSSVFRHFQALSGVSRLFHAFPGVSRLFQAVLVSESLY